MGTTFFGTTSTDLFINNFTIFQFIDTDQNLKPDDPNNPIDPKIVEDTGGFFPTPIPVVFLTTFADNAVSYASSPSAVSIDLGDNTGSFQGIHVFAALQQGGSAQGDVLVDVSEVTGSGLNDIIRGSDSAAYVDFARTEASKFPDFAGNNFDIIHNPGENVLIGGGGSDVLEGRGGADVLIGGR
jgi:hypothetical protein